MLGTAGLLAAVFAISASGGVAQRGDLRVAFAGKIAPHALPEQSPFPSNGIAQLPQVAADWGYVSGISLTLRRTFAYRGKRHSYLSAGCPAPKGFPGATFAFARAAFGFEDGRILVSTLNRDCDVKGCVASS